MPPLIIPSTVQVVCSGGLAGGERWANVWHVIDDLGVGVTQADADAIGADFRQFYTTTAGSRSAGWTLESITVRPIDEAGVNPWEASIAPLDGTSVAAPLPYECAIVVTLHTALNTRRGRGRSYQAGFTADALSANAGGAPVLLTASSTTMATAMGALLTALAGEGFPLGVASRTDLVTRPVTSGYIDTGWDTQRGRSDDILTTRAAF